MYGSHLPSVNDEPIFPVPLCNKPTVPPVLKCPLDYRLKCYNVPGAIFGLLVLIYLFLSILFKLHVSYSFSSCTICVASK